MIPSIYRLRLMKDFEILHKEGRFVNGRLVSLKIWKIEPEKYPRRKYTSEDLKIAFVVSKKIEKSAVRRNRVKRQMSEVVRLLLKDGKVRHGFMMLFISKQGALGAEYREIEEDMRELLGRARVLK